MNRNNKLDNKLSELRQQAEKIVKEKQKAFPELSELPSEEVQRVIHELRVHQIELEMQNEELCRLRNELEISRDKYLDLYDFAPIGYFTVDSNGVIQEVNLRGALLLESERCYVNGTLFYNFIFEEDKDLFYKHQQLVLKTGERQSCELRMKKKKNLQFHARIESIVAPGSSGDLIRAAVSDVTERVRLESQLRQDEKMKALGTLSAGFAHEFNNILFPIMGYIEMGILDLPKGKTQNIRLYLERTLPLCKRAALLIGQILTFTHPVEQTLTPLKLQNTVRDAIRLLAPLCPDTIALCHQTDENSGTVMGNPFQIYRILTNLYTNACEAMEKRGGGLEVSVEPVSVSPETALAEDMKPGKYARLTVRDTGCGIEPANIGRVFDPFFTTKKFGKGTGLGLSVVHGLVSQHKGIIKIDSKPGEGTAVHVYLPAISAESDVISPGTRAKEAIQGGAEHILLTDDEEAVVLMHQEFLGKLGYRVSSFTESPAALEAFRLHPDAFDLVITDTSMPEMTGAELAREIFKIRLNTPIIICTGYSETMNEETAKAMGIRECIKKPVSISEFAAIIRKVLDRKD